VGTAGWVSGTAVVGAGVLTAVVGPQANRNRLRITRKIRDWRLEIGDLGFDISYRAVIILNLPQYAGDWKSPAECMEVRGSGL
jgi:hypothetical protein